MVQSLPIPFPLPPPSLPPPILFVRPSPIEPWTVACIVSLKIYTVALAVPSSMWDIRLGRIWLKSCGG